MKEKGKRGRQKKVTVETVKPIEQVEAIKPIEQVETVETIEKVEAIEEVKEKRQYIENKIVIDEGAKCWNCGNRYNHTKQHKYPNGNQRVICGVCKMPFVIRKIG